MFFRDCIGNKTKLKIILKSKFFNNKKITFNIIDKTPEELEKLFEEIKFVIKNFDK